MKKLLLIVILLINLPVYAQELSPEQIYEKINDCVVVIHSYDFNNKLSKQGSGVVISDNGWIMTNYHVFAECEKMEVIHNDKIIKYTDIIGVDVEKDILILKIENNTFPSISLGSSDNLKVGQRIYAIGSPLGFENSMSEGIISGLRNVNARNRNYIQITASISSGSSGGAVVNNRGELIGISTMTISEGQNLNFAIPINDILSVSRGSFGDKKSIKANNYFFKGWNASESGNNNEAIKYYTKFLEIFPNGEEAYNNRGAAYFELQDYPKAISDYTKAIEINPNGDEAYNNRGNAYSKLQDYRKAISDYTKAIEINPKCEVAYYNRGVAYFELQDYFKAISDETKAIEINPNHEYAYYNRGNAYSKLQDYPKAISDHTKAIEINPNYEEAYYNRGNAYSKLQDYRKAISDYTKAIEINPNGEEAYNNRGNSYLRLGDYSKAISDHTKTIEINPDYIDAYLDRGIAYMFLGNTSKACEDWSIAKSRGSIKAKELYDIYCK